MGAIVGSSHTEPEEVRLDYWRMIVSKGQIVIMALWSRGLNRSWMDPTLRGFGLFRSAVRSAFGGAPLRGRWCMKQGTSSMYIYVIQT